MIHKLLVYLVTMWPMFVTASQDLPRSILERKDRLDTLFVRSKMISKERFLLGSTIELGLGVFAGAAAVREREVGTAAAKETAAQLGTLAAGFLTAGISGFYLGSAEQKAVDGYLLRAKGPMELQVTYGEAIMELQAHIRRRSRVSTGLIMSSAGVAQLIFNSPTIKDPSYLGVALLGFGLLTLFQKTAIEQSWHSYQQWLRDDSDQVEKYQVEWDPRLGLVLRY